MTFYVISIGLATVYSKNNAVSIKL